MIRRQPYSLHYARGVVGHLTFIDAKYDKLIRNVIEEQLKYEPNVETRNRKPMRHPAPFTAGWEIRFDPQNRFRVMYDVDEENHTVQILAIGVKVRNRLFVGGIEVE
jgi:mRNA-degrading endonuclease RelE of RelBE toxin-antitoxin system